MGNTLHQGWAILTFADGRPALAGELRYEQVGMLYQWVLDVPPGNDHKGYLAILDPLHAKSVTPCTESEAIAFADAPARRREPPAA